MNNVDIGTLTAKEYQDIRRTVLRDPNKWAEQILNLAGAMTKLMSEMMIGVPAITFWFVFLVAGFVPGTGEMLVHLLQPGERENLFFVVLTMAMAYATLLLLGALAFGKDWGIRNTLQGAINDLVRQKLNVPVTGDIRLSYIGHLQGAAR